MQSNPEALCRAGKLHRFLPGRSRDHEAGIGQNALPMGVQYASVDLSGQAEVVPVDDEIASNRDGRRHSSARTVWAIERVKPFDIGKDVTFSVFEVLRKIDFRPGQVVDPLKADMMLGQKTQGRLLRARSCLGPAPHSHRE